MLSINACLLLWRKTIFTITVLYFVFPVFVIITHINYITWLFKSQAQQIWILNKNLPTHMNLEILTPERKFFSGDVYGVQLPGVVGSFEILDRHAPIVSALKAGRLKILKDKNQHYAFFDIQSGFVEMINNKATVLVEGAMPVETP